MRCIQRPRKSSSSVIRGPRGVLLGGRRDLERSAALRCLMPGPRILILR